MGRVRQRRHAALEPVCHFDLEWSQPNYVSYKLMEDARQQAEKLERDVVPARQ